jgi:signal transduction histidine kinase
MSRPLPERSFSGSAGGTAPLHVSVPLAGGEDRLTAAVQSRRLRGEVLIAVGRLVLITFSLLALWLDPLPSGQDPATAVLLTFSAYSVGALILILSTSAVPHRARIAAHAIDLLFITALVLVTQGTISFFFLFFIFVLLSGTLRFGSRGTVLTAVAAVAAYVIASLSGELFAGAEFEINRFLIRISHLVVLAALLVFLGRYDERMQEDIARLAEWSSADGDDLRAVLQSALSQAAAILGAERMVATIEGEEPWTEVATWEGGSLRIERLDPDRLEFAVSPRLTAADFIADDGASSSASVVYAGGGRLRSWSGPALAVETERAPYERAPYGGPVVSVRLAGRTFQGRLFGFAAREMTADDLLLAGIVGVLVRARIDEFHMLRATGKTAVERERIRVARDLHDGLLQSLTAVGLQLQALQNHLDDPAKLRSTLSDIRQIIDEDHRELRRFVQHLHPSTRREVSMRLEERLSELGLRIRRQWAIELEFEVAPEVRTLREELLHDLYSIVHEAVANTARHASPSCIVVRIRTDRDDAVVFVSNDGKGFPFKGRYTLAELQAIERGPVSLKERIALLGGEMILDSRENGTELLMRIPRAEVDRR